MSATVHYTACPVCGSSHINPLLTVQDHTVSKENFVVWQCSDCTLRFTQDVPDEASVGRYYKSAEYISHTDSDKGLVNQLYKRVRKITLRQKADLIIKSSGILKGSLLDVGSGTGAFLHTMKEKGWQTVGLEPDADARQMAKQLYGLSLQEPSELQGFSPASFDVITLWHVLEHVHELHGYMAQLKNLLRANGKLIIAVPNYRSLDAGVYGLNWAAYDVPRHLYHFSPLALDKLVQMHGMKVVAKRPMWFDAFYISMLSSKYRHGKTKLFTSFINGMRSNIKAAGNNDYCSSLIYIVQKA